MSVTCATKPLSTLKKLTVLYAPSLASFWMCAELTGATCAAARRTQCEPAHIS